jgi:hypothetical protein
MTDSEYEGLPREGDHRTEGTEDTEDFFWDRSLGRRAPNPQLKDKDDPRKTRFDAVGRDTQKRGSSRARSIDWNRHINLERQRALHPRNSFRNRTRPRARARTPFTFPMRRTNAFRSIESPVFRTAERSLAGVHYRSITTTRASAMG